MNRQVVVDASAFVACVLPDESTPRGLADALADAEFVLPALWPAEVANTLLMAERRSRIERENIARILNDLHDRPLIIEPANLELSMHAAAEVARAYSLSVYDASYLELAQRRRLPLATLDDALSRAARKAKVELL